MRSFHPQMVVEYMDLSFAYSPFLIFLIVAAAAAISYWMYRQSQALLPPLTRWLLTIFRFVVLTLIGILLLQPTLVFKQSIAYPPIIALLQDNTESLVVQRDSQFVREAYPQLLKDFQAAFGDEDIQVDTYTFSDGLASGELDSLTFDQTGTNLGQSLRSLDRLYQNQHLKGVVLLSDGISTAGINPIYAIEGSSTPIHTVLIGDTTVQQDVQIREVLFNEIAYLKNEMPIRVNVQATGYDQANVVVTLRDEEKVLARENLRLGRNQTQGRVDFFVEPQEAGQQSYQISVSRLEDEISYRNNYRRIFVNVLETRVKIAVFAGAPHPDLGALRKAFEREDSYEVSEFILRDNQTYYDNPNNFNLEDFDLFILHNFPHSSADQAMVAKLVEEINTNKKPVIFMVGMFADMRTMQPLYPYMALSPTSFNPRSQEVILNFKRDYRNHSTFTFADSWIQWVNTSPPMFRNQSIWKAKPTAEVFATVKIKNIPLNYPSYALQSHLGRKNMVLIGENFWRMRAHAYTENGDFESFDAWLFNNIKWLIVSDDKRKFKVNPTKRLFVGSDPVSFTGQAYDDSYNPLSGVDIKLSLKGPDQKETDYYLNESGQGRYFLEVGTLPEGTYSFQAVGRKNETRVGEDRGQFSVGESNIEHLQLQADRELLEQIALRTEGSFQYARDLPALAEALKTRPDMKPKLDSQRTRSPFHHFGWLLLLFLLLLSVEWVIRKWYSMI
ncbi:MAG: hypothetical protein AAFR61_23030 [Bacteroidota bacterium]